MQLRYKSLAPTRPQVACIPPRAPSLLRTPKSTAIRFKEDKAPSPVTEPKAKHNRRRLASDEALSDPETSRDPFLWTKQWYPVYVIENLDTSVPHKFELLGKSVAVWRNPVTGTWACVEDRCPHRAAPLSQGQVIKTTGELRCAYHGWTFDQQGKCTDVPSSAKPERICNMRGSCVASRPVREAHGVLWVWGESGPTAHIEAAKTPLPTDGLEEFSSPEWEMTTPWYQRFGPVSFFMQIENSFDLAHTPFVHHGLMGLRRDQAVRGFPVSITRADTLPGGFTAVYGAASTMAVFGDVDANFRPPTSFLARSARQDGTPTLMVIFRAPIAPGRSLNIVGDLKKKSASPASALFSLLPVWLNHLMALNFGDQDYIIMHYQEHYMQQHGGAEKTYLIPDPTDAAVKAMMVWMRKAGPIPYPQGQTLPPALTPEQVMDHYSQHVAHCKHCQRGLATVRLVSVLAGLAAGLLAAAAAAQAGVASVSSVSVPALPWLAVAAVVLGWVSWSAFKLQRKFLVGDWDSRRNV